MNTLQKTFLYPTIITGIIIFITCLNWILTKFFSIIFSISIEEAAISPMILLYVTSAVGCLYMIVICCQYIDEKL
jgi:hypothetical protein